MVNDTGYVNWSYQQLSTEANRFRAFKLIPLMYDRLTKVDRLSHKVAMDRIYNDHKYLSGFSIRNIRRYLPLSNDVVPRRIRTSHPKNSTTEINALDKLSNTTHVDFLVEKLIGGKWKLMCENIFQYTR